MKLIHIEGFTHNAYLRKMKFTVQIFLMAFLFSSCSYLPGEKTIESSLKKDRADYALYHSGTSVPEKAILLVPGGLVDPYVYSCWIDHLVSRDSTIAVVLVKYASNLPIIHTGKVMKVKRDLTSFNRWVIGGHSLGGTVAASVVNQHRELFDGLILMASWAGKASDLSDWEGTVLSIYGSEDKVATTEEILGNSDFLPEGIPILSPDELTILPGQTSYYEIYGGNHSGFGCYGPQEGDGEAMISSTEQQELMVLMVDAYLDAIW